ncbi:MAG: phosphoenolpyruvate--protein phosphotransferase [Elusimicrobia bacterium]|nr:phosphoenolpyruvate--protein phosphotransferase [Elusimicrobiota bacterium]
MGFATDTEGRTSHIVNMADSLGIPAVVGLKRVTRQASPGDLIIIDGNDGYVHINPPPEVVRSYRKKKRAQEDLRKELVKLKDKAPVTRCGTNIDLCVNIESSGEASSVQEYGASGIGLFRTEFMYINRKTLPEEEEVYSEIKEVAEMAHPKPVVVRTIDLGADKMAEQLNMKPEMNSFMGMRGIRLSLAYPGLFKTHLRAILRASVKGNLVLMYPMITGIKELRSANHILREVKEDLDASGIEYDKNLKVGVMVETPAAVIEIERLARDADFLSIGTNDLIQYSLAVDRISDGVSHLYNPSDLAILGMLRMVIEAGRKFSRPVSMCGEMASDEFYTELLIGMGLRSFSMSGVGLPAIKQVVINADIEKCRLLAEEVLAADDNAEVIEILRDNRRQKRQF